MGQYGSCVWGGLVCDEERECELNGCVTGRTVTIRQTEWTVSKKGVFRVTPGSKR